MQEYLFSRRRLLFGPDRVTWDCVCAFWVENEVNEILEIPRRIRVVGPLADNPELPVDSQEFSCVLRLYDTLL